MQNRNINIKMLTLLIFILFGKKISAQYKLLVIQHNDNYTSYGSEVREDSYIFNYSGEKVISPGVYDFNTSSINYNLRYMIRTNNSRGCRGEFKRGTMTVGDQVTYNTSNLTSNIDCVISHQTVFIKEMKQRLDNTICGEDSFIQEEDGGGFGPFTNTFIGYWEYQTKDSNEWKKVIDKIRGDQFDGYPMTLTLNDFEEDFTNYTGSFRLRFKFRNYTSDILNYSIIYCSPNLKEPISTDKTICDYSNDGKFKMTFDRDLKDNEKLVVSIYKKQNDNLIFFDQETSSTLIKNLDESYSYSWVKGLAPEKYYLKYQTLVGNGNIPSSDPSWTTLQESSFTINKSLKVQFEARKKNDETCFEKGDGKIEIYNIRGESDRSFSYIITKPDGTNKEVQINGMTEIISGLKLGLHKIKVKDSKECFAKKI
ncbi:hypothetical protein OAT18_03090 [Tenacibaculum sp.]|nr:hypothetical protein [Tenacibaculum sp.]